MLRVAILCWSLAGGGVQGTALTITKHLVKRGHAVDLLSQDPTCAWPDGVPDGVRFFYVTDALSLRTLAARQRELDQSEVFSGATVIPRPAVSRWQRNHASIVLACRWRSWYRSLVTRDRPLFIEEKLARRAFKVAVYLDRERPDAVLCMAHYSTEWAAFARDLSRHRARMVATLNGWLLPQETRWAGYAYSRVDAVAVVSRDVARYAVDVLGVRVPVHMIYSPLVDSKALRKAAGPVDHPWIGGDVPVVLSVGRLEKDYPTLLRAVALLAARRPVRLIALGEGKKAARLRELQDLAQSLGIAGAVDFAGFVANPLAYMARADLCVLSSKHEGMPQVLVQAMMVGCRMAATDCDFGPAELLGGGEYGRLAPVGDPVRLAEAMDRELDTPRDAARLRARAAELFDVERSIDAYEALLGIGGGGTGRPSVGRLRKLLPIPTLAVWALGLILVGAGLFSDAASMWWIGASGLALVGLVGAKESILWRWRREQLREELAGQRRQADLGLAAERQRAERE